MDETQRFQTRNKLFVFYWFQLGADVVRCFAVCLRFLQFIGAEFCLAAAAARPSWFRHWMCATVVSLESGRAVDEFYYFFFRLE